MQRKAMALKITSLIALGLVVAAALFLLNEGLMFSQNPLQLLIQGCAMSLMIWARIAFGIRSFHAAANPTKGKLITHGPYRWLRHPIYAAIIYFFFSCTISFPFEETFIAVGLIVAGLLTRAFIEERFLLAAYEEYASYSKGSKRIIPFVF